MNDKPLIGIVDDDESVRMALGTLLRSVGLHNRAYASGAEYLSHRPGGRFGCLIVDIRMKGMSGLELQAELRRGGDTTPLIFISAHGEDDHRRRALAARPFGFLAKPFDEAALLALVRGALASCAG